MHISCSTNAPSCKACLPADEAIGKGECPGFLVYLPIQRLAHAPLLNHDPRRTLMVHLTAYFDASGSPSDAHALTMAGFVSSEAKWHKLETEWNEVLKRYEVPYLHMKEFTCSTGHFKTWKNDEERRKHFLIDLVNVTKKRVHKSFGCSVILEDFHEVNRHFKLREKWGRPYSLVGIGAVSRVIDWKHRRFPNASIKYVFEAGDTHAGDLKKCMDEMKLPYSFMPKSEKQNGEDRYIVPFQIADFAAWENRTAVTRASKDPLQKLRHSFEALYKQIPSNWRVFTKEGLSQMCEFHSLHR